MIRLERATLTPEEYQQLFCEGFGEYNGEMSQAVFLIVDDKSRVGFCSIYAHNKGHLYLQYIAFAKAAENGKKYGYYLETLKVLHAFGFPFIMGAISNTNKRALMWALRSGFEINGTRQAVNGILYVEVLHKEVV